MDTPRPGQRCTSFPPDYTTIKLIIISFYCINATFFASLQKFDRGMATREEVEAFLNGFHAKMKVFRIVFRDDRGKNAQALAELDITPQYREKVIREIVADDYSQGPILDTLHTYGEMWVFGKDVKRQEVYIKISLGHPNSATICISFHKAERPLVYPFKK